MHSARVQQAQYARPSYVSLIPGGRQEFPNDAITSARLTREAHDRARREGRKVFHRRAK